MITKFVKSNVSGGDGSLNKPWNAAEMGQRVKGNTVVEWLPGEYSGRKNKLDVTLATVNSGGSESQIFHRGKGALIRDRFNLGGVAFHNFEDFMWSTIDKAWIIDSGGSGARNITLRRITFDSKGRLGGTGIMLHGANHLIIDCKFYDWLAGDMVNFANARNVAIISNDFRDSRAGHCLIGFTNVADSRVMFNTLSNPLARAILISHEDPGSCHDILFAQNTLYRCNDGINDEFPGDGESIRILAERCIIRDNLLVDNWKGQENGNGGDFRFNVFGNTNWYRKTRLYNNTIWKSHTNAICLTGNANAVNPSRTDNKFMLNVLAEYADYAIRIAKSDIPWESYIMDQNLIWHPTKTKAFYIKGEVPNELTVAEAQKKYPEIISDNIFAAPIFADPAIVNSFTSHPGAHTDMLVVRNAFRSFNLMDGKLTRTTAPAVDSVRLKVRDSLFFTIGDQIRLEGVDATFTVVERPDDFTLIIDSKVRVPVDCRIRRFHNGQVVNYPGV